MQRARDQLLTFGFLGQGGRDEQRLRARSAASGDPAQGDERRPGDVGRPGRGGRAHRRGHRRPQDQSDPLRHHQASLQESDVCVR